MSSRPLPVTLAVVLLALLGLGNLLAPLISKGIPTPAVYLLVVVGLINLLGAVGLWMLKRWALWLVIVVSVLNILMNAPAMVSAAPVIYVVVSALVIVLAILPASRHAYS